MIDTNGLPDAWIYNGGRVHCARHAEGKFGPRLYRDPRPTDDNGRVIKPAVMSGPEKCFECQRDKAGGAKAVLDAARAHSAGRRQ